MWQITAKLGKHRGASWPIGPNPLVIGRSPQCDVVVRDIAVSRAHCRIMCVNEAVVCHDLGSTNTTLVNGQPIEQCVLAIGDEILVGNAVFIVTLARVHPMSPSSAPADDTTIGMLPERLCAPGTIATSTSVHAKPRHGRDLEVLHELAGRLAECSGRDAVACVILACLHENLPIAECWLRCRSESGDATIYPAGAALSETCAQCLREAEASTEASPFHALAPGRGARDAWLIPVRHRSKRLGSLCIMLDDGSPADTEGNIGFAMCVVRAATPFLNESSTDAARNSRSPRIAREVERVDLERVLQETGGRIAEAASILGIHRNTLREMMKQYGL